MPFQSQAQRRKFQAMLAAGEITQATFDEWERETAGRHLPEHVPQIPAPRKRKATARRRRRPRR
jgi:hypothetical protein